MGDSCAAMVTLDGFDRKIIAALQSDGRLTNQQLADKVGLSPSQCSRRRVGLEQTGIIRGYRADIVPEAVGFAILAFIQVTLATHTRDNAQLFRRLVLSAPSVQEAHALTGDADYLLKVRLATLSELAAFVNETLLAHPSVARVSSSVVFESLKDHAALPIK